MNDRNIRSLVALERSASTARVLNLAATHRKLGHDRTLEAQPFFENRLLNHSIIVKHRVRPHERERFAQPLATVTKILTPMDASDLKVGARVLMVGQKDFDAAAEELFGEALTPGARDRQVLDLIDELPSLDPFLLREHLKRNGFEPARAYFAITDADIVRMYDFVRAQVMSLVTLSSGSGGGSQAASRLVDKLLSNAPDAGFEPLKETLRLDDKDYQDGIFCWRGFLYYKWVLAELTPQLAQVMVDLAQLQPRGPQTSETAAYLPGARRRIEAAVTIGVEDVNRLLEVYDSALSLPHAGRPAHPLSGVPAGGARHVHGAR